MKKFNLKEDDYFAIDIAKGVAFKFLQHPRITPQEIVRLKSAIDALEKLPDITPDIFIIFGVYYRVADEDWGEMRHIDFTVSEDSFRISIGGSVYSKDVGGDSFSSPGWTIETGGYREEGCELWTLEDDIVELLNLGAEVVISDESDI
jgi:hypothetical protein